MVCRLVSWYASLDTQTLQNSLGYEVGREGARMNRIGGGNCRNNSDSFYCHCVQVGALCRVSGSYKLVQITALNSTNRIFLERIVVNFLANF